uniref:CCHC-type domain-containing protein n=1 Tax=Callorhinchus milii TaxID=7868 RepID=A0A4W3JV70_CALMI
MEFNAEKCILRGRMKRAKFPWQRKGRNIGAKTQVVCYHCGKPRHIKPECKGLECRICGKKGHNIRDCRSKIQCQNCGEMGHVTKYCRHEGKSAGLDLKDVVGQINSEFGKL